MDFRLFVPWRSQDSKKIYPTGLHLNKVNPSDTEAPFLDLDLSITNGIVSTKIYDKRDFNFEIANFPFLWRCSPLPFLWSIHFATYSFCKSMFSC